MKIIDSYFYVLNDIKLLTNFKSKNECNNFQNISIKIFKLFQNWEIELNDDR